MYQAIETENDLMVVTRNELLAVIRDWYAGEEGYTLQDADDTVEFLFKQVNARRVK